MPKAIVKVDVCNLSVGLAPTPACSTIECSTDCPADALGEVVSQCLQKAWASGVDPVKDNLQLLITFGVSNGQR